MMVRLEGKEWPWPCPLMDSLFIESAAINELQNQDVWALVLVLCYHCVEGEHIINKTSRKS